MAWGCTLDVWYEIDPLRRAEMIGHWYERQKRKAFIEEQKSERLERMKDGGKRKSDPRKRRRGGLPQVFTGAKFKSD